MKWYIENKDKLVWVESMSSSTSDCFSPTGGHYEMKKHKQGKDRNITFSSYLGF